MVVSRHSLNATPHAASQNINTDKVASEITASSRQNVEMSEAKKTTTERSMVNIRDVVIKPVRTERFFSIQICTYRAESDAKKLVGRLEGFNLPAFYTVVPGRQGEGKFYIVFVGKDESYSETNTRLSKFKQLPVSHEFPDAYIRKG